MKVWKQQYEPFRFGGKLTMPISTEVSDDFPRFDLGKGFSGILILYNNKSYVFEVQSGGLIGDSLDSVRADIENCQDIGFMQEQVEEAAELRDEAVKVTYEEFFNGRRL